MNTLKTLSSINLGALLNGKDFSLALPECEKLIKVIVSNGDASEWFDGSTKQSTIEQMSAESNSCQSLLNHAKDLYCPYAEKAIDELFDVVRESM